MLESLEKLRKYELFDKGIKVSAYMPSDKLADEIQAEVDERYMLLPVDADGVPLHVGETVYDSKNNETKVLRIEFDCNEKAYVYCKIIDGNGMINVAPEYLTHVKPRTIEDVLRDCCNEWNQHCGDDWEQGVYAEYADELRELIGGGAQ